MVRTSAFMVFLLASIPLAALSDEPPRFEFTRMVAHWHRYDDPAFLPFIEEAQPDLVQHGFYGAHFWSLVHTPQFGGYPSHFPVQGIDQCRQWFEKRNAELHKRKAKVIGHFNVEFLVGEPDSDEGPRGFFHFYQNLWDEKQLGPKPAADPIEFLEKGADGKPIINNSYKIGGMHEYWACLRNPAWQRVLKAWVKHGIDRGLDGFIANYFYRHNCLCQHCQDGFRSYLSERFSKEELQQRFGINNAAAHEFEEIVCWHKPEESTPLRREMLRWSQISNKQVFDDVFAHYGRTLKSDLIVAQWNHLGNFGQISSDERCLLPTELWGKGEDYLWYSTGAAANSTRLENRFLGEGTLQARYIRGAFDDKPFTLGKYENTRIRVAIAELAANGGAPMGFYARFTDPAARKEIARYYQFIRRYESVYKANQPHAEVAFLFPRTAVHAGDISGIAKFRDLGTKLLDTHVLFDVLPDDDAGDKRISTYAHVVRISDSADSVILNDTAVSRFDAPFTVRVSSSRPVTGREITLHFVNYNREEPPLDAQGRPSAGRGIEDEKPIRTSPFTANLQLPPNTQVQRMESATPESADAVPLRFASVADGTIQFIVPDFLVYRIVRVHLLN
ncbi:MAG TPA: hypothetical protein QF564_12050 [Pirellulaceae bacterium]|nr:hypothetical protein [Pirellulaceae bacterium]